MEWHLVLVAVATGTVMHEVMEPGNVLYKLRRLEKAIKTGKIETPPLKGIDTRAKAYGLSFISILVSSVIVYFIAKWINPSLDTALAYSVAVLLLGAAIATVQIDKYHVQIEKLTQKQKR